jgi:hypothetical protein
MVPKKNTKSGLPVTPAPVIPAPVTPTAPLTPSPGARAYRVGVVHIDMANSTVVVEFALGIVAVDGSFFETSRSNFSVSRDAFTEAGFDTSWMQTIPEKIAPLCTALQGVSFFGS